MDDHANAFIEQFELKGASSGPLAGLTVGIKDIFDIAGHKTGCGNPTWLETHEPAPATAPCIQTLLDAGATIVGKTHTDELAYSLMGANAHYGTPLNTKAPDRVPGGSSCGSVAATAAELVDFAIGSDTGGSVRMPAGFCGIYGIRTTHDAIPLDGVMPLAPSFDVCGWFARDTDVLSKVGVVYGFDASTARKPSRLLVAEDAFDHAGEETASIVRQKLDGCRDHFGTVETIELAPAGFRHLFKTFLLCQAYEAWQSHGAWITANNPTFGPGVKERFDLAESVTEETWMASKRDRAEIADRLYDVLGDDTVIALPTGPGPAPLRSTPEDQLNDFRTTALEMLSSAGLAGLPQINIPAGLVDGGPVGLSFVGARGQDAALLSLCGAIEKAAG